MIKVLICDDERLVRWALKDLIETEPGLAVAGEAANGYEALEQALALTPDVTLMDVRMPLLDGLEATRLIVARNVSTKIVLLSAYSEMPYVLDGIRAGAKAYVLKEDEPLELRRTIERVHSGECFIQPDVASRIVLDVARNPPPGIAASSNSHLTEREISVLTRLAHGMTNREIGRDLHLCEGTVKNYVSSILSKMRASNRVQAIEAARDLSIIPQRLI